MADTVTPLRPNRAPAEPRKLPYSGRLPEPFSGVTVTVDTSWECLRFEYCAATDQELIACGAVTDTLLSMRRTATKLDELRLVVHISHRGGRCTVVRYRQVDDKQDLPGFEPWMLDALRQQNEAREAERKASAPPNPKLNVEAWRRRYVEMVRCAGDVLIAAAEMGRDKLEAGYQVLDADRLAYRARAQAAIDELAGMLERLRIVRTDGGTPQLRLIVDNTREVRP